MLSFMLDELNSEGYYFIMQIGYQPTLLIHGFKLFSFANIYCGNKFHYYRIYDVTYIIS